MSSETQENATVSNGEASLLDAILAKPIAGEQLPFVTLESLVVAQEPLSESDKGKQAIASLQANIASSASISEEDKAKIATANKELEREKQEASKEAEKALANIGKITLKESSNLLSSRLERAAEVSRYISLNFKATGGRAKRKESLENAAVIIRQKSGEKFDFSDVTREIQAYKAFQILSDGMEPVVAIKVYWSHCIKLAPLVTLDEKNAEPEKYFMPKTWMDKGKELFKAIAENPDKLSASAVEESVRTIRGDAVRDSKRKGKPGKISSPANVSQEQANADGKAAIQLAATPLALSAALKKQVRMMSEKGQAEFAYLLAPNLDGKAFDKIAESYGSFSQFDMLFIMAQKAIDQLASLAKVNSTQVEACLQLDDLKDYLMETITSPDFPDVAKIAEDFRKQKAEMEGKKLEVSNGKK